MNKISYKGKWALVTGASSGIGWDFAHALAQRGANVIVTARREEKLRALAQELRARHGVLTEVIPLDLCDPEAPRMLCDAIKSRGMKVSLLVNNAGFGSYAPFHQTQQEQIEAMLMVNIHALTAITRRLLPDMLAQKEGYVFNIASTAAFQPLPYLATYAATKAFVLSFSEALWGEYDGTGVRVIAVCPGATDTAFFADWDLNAALLGPMDTTANVVATSLAAIEHRRSYVICGPFRNRMAAYLTRFAPRAWVVKIAGRMLRRKPG
jgi:short-subunit dehydrogenase